MIHLKDSELTEVTDVRRRLTKIVPTKDGARIFIYPGLNYI